MADTFILGLCAGVGMLDEGVAAGLRAIGRRPVHLGYVERDAYAASVLLARMASKALEPTPVWAGNLEAVRWEQFADAVDILCAGFPCQPHSMAGSRKGTDDARWIWPAIADCIRVVRPSIVLLENVSGLRSSGGMAPVLADLAALGFRVEWDSIRASDVGAAHQRERVFILAVSANIRQKRGADTRRETKPWTQHTGIGMAVPGRIRGSTRISGQNAREERDANFTVNGCDDDELAHTSQPRSEGREQHGTYVADGRTDGLTI